MDLDYRRKWDSIKPDYLRKRGAQAVNQEKVVNDHKASQSSLACKSLLNQTESIYWRVPYPMFMSDRQVQSNFVVRNMEITIT
jgi:hypothetical protein